MFRRPAPPREPGLRPAAAAAVAPSGGAGAGPALSAAPAPWRRAPPPCRCPVVVATAGAPALRQRRRLLRRRPRLPPPPIHRCRQQGEERPRRPSGPAAPPSLFRIHACIRPPTLSPSLLRPQPLDPSENNKRTCRSTRVPHCPTSTGSPHPRSHSLPSPPTLTPFVPVLSPPPLPPAPAAGCADGGAAPAPPRWPPHTHRGPPKRGPTPTRAPRG